MSHGAAEVNWVDLGILNPILSTSGRIQAEFIRLLFLHAHRKAEDHVKHILGMTGVAAQPNISLTTTSHRSASQNVAAVLTQLSSTSMPSRATRDATTGAKPVHVFVVLPVADAFFYALKGKTGLILAKAAAMRINARLDPDYLAPTLPSPLSARLQMSLYTGALDDELPPPSAVWSLISSARG